MYIDQLNEGNVSTRKKNNVQFGNNQMTLLTKKVNSSESESVCISGD